MNFAQMLLNQPTIDRPKKQSKGHAPGSVKARQKLVELAAQRRRIKWYNIFKQFEGLVADTSELVKATGSDQNTIHHKMTDLSREKPPLVVRAGVAKRQGVYGRSPIRWKWIGPVEELK